MDTGVSPLPSPSPSAGTAGTKTEIGTGAKRTGTGRRMGTGGIRTGSAPGERPLVLGRLRPRFAAGWQRPGLCSGGIFPIGGDRVGPGLCSMPDFPPPHFSVKLVPKQGQGLEVPEGAGLKEIGGRGGERAEEGEGEERGLGSQLLQRLGCLC